MAGYLVNGMFIEVRYFEYINVLFFFLMGTMVGMHERHLAAVRAAEEEAATPSPEPLDEGLFQGVLVGPSPSPARSGGGNA